MPVTVRGGDIVFNDGSTQWTTAANFVNTSSVLAATAAASVGAVGTYVWARANNSSNYGPGSTIGGGSLQYGGHLTYANNNGFYGQTPLRYTSSLAGTWRCMGNAPGFNDYGASVAGTTLWLRIS